VFSSAGIAVSLFVFGVSGCVLFASGEDRTCLHQGEHKCPSTSAHYQSRLSKLSGKSFPAALAHERHLQDGPYWMLI
jgi:hypothetical protein